MSMAECQNCKAQDYIPETLWYKGIKGNALCQRLFYWLVSLRTAPQDGITNVKLGQIIAKWKSVRRKKTPRKSTGMTDYANFAFLAQSLIQFQISTLNIKRRPVLQAIENGCSFSNFITAPDLVLVQRLKLNPKIVHRTILTHHRVYETSCFANPAQRT
jgi:hypothetical protein